MTGRCQELRAQGAPVLLYQPGPAQPSRPGPWLAPGSPAPMRPAPNAVSICDTREVWGSDAPALLLGAAQGRWAGLLVMGGTFLTSVRPGNRGHLAHPGLRWVHIPGEQSSFTHSFARFYWASKGLSVYPGPVSTRAAPVPGMRGMCLARCGRPRSCREVRACADSRRARSGPLQ